MGARMRYPEVAPEGYAALSGFGHYVNTGTALEPVLLGLVYLRASVLNGCSFCIEMHKAELRKHHEPESRIEAVVSQPDADVFTPREQAALRWTAVLTNVQDGHASDEEYAAVNVFFHGRDLVDLSFAVANINAWNRLGVAFRPEWRPRAARTTTQVSASENSPAPTESSSASRDDQSAAPSAADHDGDNGKVAED